MPLLRSVLQRIGNQFNSSLKENIFFLHIPKCGGVSVSYAINWRYRTLDIRQDRYFVSLDPSASSNIIQMIEQTNYPYDTNDDYPILKLRETLLLYFMGQKNTRYISGHFTFSEIAYREFGNKYTFITILRDPVKRWISSYFYNRYKEAEHRKIEADLTTYLESDFGQSQGYEYVKFIGGPDKSGDYTSMYALERAKENLHKLDIVGFLEYQDRFLEQFEQRFGTKLNLEKRNRNPKSTAFRKSVITKEVEEKIKAICQPDYAVYQYAIDNFLKPDP